MRSVSQWFAAFGSVASGERRRGRVTILDLEGGITFGGGAADLRQHTRRLIAEGRADILLNLADVRYVDSNGQRVAGRVDAVVRRRRELHPFGIIISRFPHKLPI